MKLGLEGGGMIPNERFIHKGISYEEKGLRHHQHQQKMVQKFKPGMAFYQGALSSRESACIKNGWEEKKQLKKMIDEFPSCLPETYTNLQPC